MMAINATIRVGAACLLAAISLGSAGAAETRQMFCVAVRTVPALDQNNYDMGGQGRVFMTATFATDLNDGELMSAWRAFITDKHPATGAQTSAGDTCRTADLRQATRREQHGDIRIVSVSWAPAKKP